MTHIEKGLRGAFQVCQQIWNMDTHAYSLYTVHCGICVLLKVQTVIQNVNKMVTSPPNIYLSFSYLCSDNKESDANMEERRRSK